MAIAETKLVNEYHSITMKINGDLGANAYGWSETYNFPLQATTDDAEAVGDKLARLRANFLPYDHEIVEAIGRKVPKDRTTFPCINEPIAGKYLPKDQRTLVGNNTIPIANITIGNGSQNANPVVVPDTDSEFSVEFCDVGAFFRLQGSNNQHAIKVLHGIPGLWIGDNKGNSIPEGFSWNDEPPVAPTSIPLPDKNYWDNFIPFFNFVCATSCLIRRNPAYDPQGQGNALIKYLQIGIKRVIFRKIDGSPVGRPFGLEVGRRLS